MMRAMLPDPIGEAFVKFLSSAPLLRRKCPRCDALASLAPEADSPATFFVTWSRPGRPNPNGETSWGQERVTIDDVFGIRFGCGFDDAQ
jgi:hypothetical protein